jgi:hypothetical protein
MPLQQSSLRDFFPTIARKVWLVGLGKFGKGNPINSKTQHGAFLFGHLGQQITPTTTSTSIDFTPHSKIQKQKRTEDTEESEQEVEGKRVKISKPDAFNNLVDDEDEAVYEPQPKRRKLTPGDRRSTDLSTGSYADNSVAPDEDGFAVKEDNTGSEDEGPTNFAPSITNLLNAETPLDSDSDDESFVPEASARIGADSGGWSADDDNVPALAWASSATIQPISPITPPAINMHALTRSLPWLPRARTSRNRQEAPFVIYEDETATPPMSFDDDFEEQTGMPAARQGVLTPLDGGQENWQPVLPVVEAPVEMPAQFLQEDGGSDEEIEMELYE